MEFREGFAEALPLPDDFADVVISNGVLNLTLNKIDTLSETNEDREQELNMIAVPPGLNGETSIYISAKERINIDRLRQKLYHRVKEIHITRYPYNDFLYELP